MKKTLQITMVLFLCSITLLGQSRATRQADTFFANLSYADASKAYKALSKENATEHVLRRLGDSYYFGAQMQDAFEAYKELFDRFPNQSSEQMFRYAQALRSVGKFKDSDIWMKKFYQKASKDGRGKNFTSSLITVADLTPTVPSYTVENLKSINTVNSDFGVTDYGNTILFSSPKKPSVYIKRGHTRNNKNFLDIYKVVKDNISTTAGDNSEVRPMFTDKINSKFHESSVTFSPKRQTMYFTRNNYLRGKYKEDKDGVNKLKIYRATWNKRKWDDVEELPFNSDDYSTGHPSLSADGTKLYFVSDMPGGLGGTDIYVVSIEEDGSFGVPQNLGPTVNTEGREMFPYIALDDVLYFSSDGHFGIGALDVFSTVKGKEGYTIPVNLQAPVNSKMDDFAFSINPFTKQGYLSSNRLGGLGDDDIYGVTQLEIVKPIAPCEQMVTGIVRDTRDQSLLPGAKVVLKDTEGKIVQEVYADASAQFSFTRLACDTNYTLTGSKEYYKDDSAVVLTTKDKKLTVDLDLAIASDFARNERGDLIIRIEPIYFDYDKSNIRPDAAVELDNIVNIMRKYPNMIIESGSHTDARGRASYNEALSERRAQSTVNYIVSRGINRSRISGRGYGETRLVNGCTDNDSHTNRVKCSREEHQQNRRTEFVIVTK
ncbi:OmpA family protein [uncultured Polaribacter sp.]|uniref:OmpA family protein n=1 Tax=uncultured Polaribacter sp. TaxID=174711 RepID=UPI002614346A|nr:OmpA family protein [uncultured Polaribacter sp.]